MNETTGVEAHYSSASLLDNIERDLAAMGVTTPFDPNLLSPVDELHIGGHNTTVPFLARLGLTPGQQVLDLGCGLGGPARAAAKGFGVTVTGVDLTGDFIRTGNALSQMTGLSDRVTLLQGSVLDLPLADDRFDAAYMIHVGMNIADKTRMMAQAARVLKPGGIFGIFDVLRSGDGALAYPVPWAGSAAQCAVAPLAEYRDALTAAGFDITDEQDRSRMALDFFRAVRARRAADAAAPPALSVQLVLGADAGDKARNLAANVSAGLIAPFEILARLPG